MILSCYLVIISEEIYIAAARIVETDMLQQNVDSRKKCQISNARTIVQIPSSSRLRVIHWLCVLSAVLCQRSKFNFVIYFL